MMYNEEEIKNIIVTTEIQELAKTIAQLSEVISDAIESMNTLPYRINVVYFNPNFTPKDVLQLAKWCDGVVLYSPRLTMEDKDLPFIAYRDSYGKLKEWWPDTYLVKNEESFYQPSTESLIKWKSFPVR